jgi:cysteine-rich repeat protein
MEQALARCFTLGLILWSGATTGCACGSDERIWPGRPDVNGAKPSAECGNGVREHGEACDDGNDEPGDGCSPNCSVLDICSLPEDRGTDGCIRRKPKHAFFYDRAENTCRPLAFLGCGGNENAFVSQRQCEKACVTACGDGAVAGKEECDDGNLVAGDGCSDRCVREGIVSIDAGAIANGCPHIESYAASPLQTAVGSYVTLSARVVDPEGDPFDVRWTASAGNVVLTPEPTRVEYRCTSAGRHGLTLEVGDGRRCRETREVEVTCVPRIPVCGDGYVDVSEECEDGNRAEGDGCSSACQLEPVCGDGVRHPPEGCDDGNTLEADGCSSWCQPDDSGMASNRCPRLRSMAVVPPAIGEAAFALLAEADDPDGDAVTYLWSAPARAIEQAASAQASYRCAGEGMVPVSLRVADARGCARTYDTHVRCR